MSGTYHQEASSPSGFIADIEKSKADPVRTDAQAISFTVPERSDVL